MEEVLRMQRVPKGWDVIQENTGRRLKRKLAAKLEVFQEAGYTTSLLLKAQRTDSQARGVATCTPKGVDEILQGHLVKSHKLNQPTGAGRTRLSFYNAYVPSPRNIPGSRIGGCQKRN